MLPSGQGLWFFLLTGPHTGPIPGLFRAGRAAMAEELGWDQEAFDEAFQEVSANGMAKADFKAKLVWLPQALKHNKPESPNVVKSWRIELDLLPECDLKQKALDQIRETLLVMGGSYAEAFDEVYKIAPKKESPKAISKPYAKPFDKPMPNQEQEQEQEQKQEQEQEQTPTATPLAPAVAVAPKKSPGKKLPEQEPPNPLNLETWLAYKTAYAERYTVAPVRDAATNAKIKMIVNALGVEGPPVAAFFVGHNSQRYVGGMHQIGLLATDYAKLRTEWATNTRMTATKAVQSDKTATNHDVFAPMIAEAKAREAIAAAEGNSHA